MAQITLPPNDRAVGTPNPPGDMNEVITALLAMSATSYLTPTGDTSGVDDAGYAMDIISAGGIPVLGPGAFYWAAGTVVIDATYQPVYGSGRWVTAVYGVGSGDALRIYNTSTTGLLTGGGATGFTIDGTHAGSGSAGLHFGDMRAAELGIAVQNFSGTSSMGVHLDNQYSWTEENHGYLWLSNNTQNLVFDVSAPAGTTVAAGSNGGEISAIASWSSPSAGVLDIASAALLPTAGTINVAASGSTTAVVTYTGISGNSLTGCAYVSGSASGTVSTGGAVGLVTSTNSFGYTDLTCMIISKVGQDSVVCQNGAVPYNGALRIRANHQGSTSSQSNAVLRLTGDMPAGHPNSNYSGLHSMRLDVQAECNPFSGGTNAPQTINFGTLGGNSLLGCTGILDFAQGTVAFVTTNWTATGDTGSFSFFGAIRGDFNLNNATVGLGEAYSFICQGTQSFGKSAFTDTGHMLVEDGDFFDLTLNQDITVTLNPDGAAAFGSAQRKVVVITQAASGGPYTVTWPNNASPTVTNCSVVWAGGVAPTMSTGASAVDVYYLDTYNGATWYGSAQQNVS